jgi:hypothetical protein
MKRAVAPHVGKTGRPAKNDIERQKYLAERRQKALDLRVAGFTPAQIIAANIGYDNLSILSKDLKASYHKIWIEDPSELIMLDLERLDEMQRLSTHNMRKVNRDGYYNTPEADRLTRIMGFRHTLLGITPERIADEVLNQKRLNESGILVIQGTAVGSEHDYVKRMMLASGMSEDAANREIHKMEQQRRDTQGVTRAIAGAQDKPGQDSETIINSPGNAGAEPDRPPARTGAHNARGRAQAREAQNRKTLVIPRKLAETIDGSLAQKSVEQQVDDFELPEYAPDPMPVDIRQPIVNVTDTQKLVSARLPGEHIRDTVQRVVYGDVQEAPDMQQPGSRRLKVRVNLEGLAHTNQPAHPGVPYREPPRKNPQSHSSQAPGLYDEVAVDMREEPF